MQKDSQTDPFLAFPWLRKDNTMRWQDGVPVDDALKVKLNRAAKPENLVGHVSRPEKRKTRAI